MILTGPAIRDAIKAGDIEIDPLDESLINPASIDMRLGTEVASYVVQMHKRGYLDAKEKNELSRNIMGGSGFFLEPGQLYLMHTAETICSRSYVAVVDGKSSLGRLGISVHQTAGYIDPGFNGQITLEVTSLHRVKIYPGMRFCQVRFHCVEGQIVDYKEKGHYVGHAAFGAVGSMTYQQLKEDKK